MPKVFMHNANEDVEKTCDNCFYKEKTDIEGLIYCLRDDRTKDSDMICKHWMGE